MTMIDSKTLIGKIMGAQADEPSLIRDDFMTAMRKVASSVTLITAVDDAGNPHGMAATAVISATIDPPSMLVAVNQSASLASVLGKSEHFCINLLSSDQIGMVETFSKSAYRGERFASAKWQTGFKDLPVHADALTAIACRKEVFFEYGTHGIYIGRVVSVSNRQEGTPLVWLGGGQARIR